MSATSCRMALCGSRWRVTDLATRLKRAADQTDLIAILARARPMLVAELKADAAKYRRVAGEIEREDQTP